MIEGMDFAYHVKKRHPLTSFENDHHLILRRFSRNLRISLFTSNFHHYVSCRATKIWGRKVCAIWMVYFHLLFSGHCEYFLHQFLSLSRSVSLQRQRMWRIHCPKQHSTNTTLAIVSEVHIRMCHLYASFVYASYSGWQYESCLCVSEVSSFCASKRAAQTKTMVKSESTNSQCCTHSAAHTHSESTVSAVVWLCVFVLH